MMATATASLPLYRRGYDPAWPATIEHLWRSCKAAAEVVDELEATYKALPKATDRVNMGWLLERAYECLAGIERYAAQVMREEGVQ